MSRILEALRKVESAGAAGAASLPRAAEAHARAEALARAEDETARATAAAPAMAPEPAWAPGVLPTLPEDFERELAALRLQVDAALAGRRPRVLLVTSATPGEGTTTVAASFARVLAQDAGARVLLVDANGYRPALARVMGVPAGPGLASALLSGRGPEGLVHAAERHNLHVWPAAAGDAAAGRLLTAPALRRFLAEFGGQYEYVIFDAPSVLEAPETVVLGSVVDTSLLVVRAAATKSGVAGRAVDTLAKAGVPLLGVVLNRRRLDIPEFIYKRI